MPHSHSESVAGRVSWNSVGPNTVFGCRPHATSCLACHLYNRWPLTFHWRLRNHPSLWIFSGLSGSAPLLGFTGSQSWYWLPILNHLASLHSSPCPSLHYLAQVLMPEKARSPAFSKSHWSRTAFLALCPYPPLSCSSLIAGPSFVLWILSTVHPVGVW